MNLLVLFERNFGVVLAAVIFILTCILWRRKKTPPGPWLVPFIGMIPGFVGGMRGEYMTKWAEQCKSKIIQVRILGMKVVVLCSYDLIHEVFLKRSDVADRMDSNNISYLAPDHEGIAFSSGPIWRDSRRVTVRMMRDLGMTNNNADSYITEECEALMAEFDKFNGSAFNPMSYLNKATSNVINCFLFRKRFDYNDEKFNQALMALNTSSSLSTTPVGTFILSFKLGRWIFKEKFRKLLEWNTTIQKFVDEQIQEHQQRFNGTVSDLIDAFLEDSPNEGRKLEPVQIQSNVFEMFTAGTEIVNIQLQWLLLYMSKYQQVQEKVHTELADIYSHKKPDSQYKKLTPYTDAVIYEVMRLRTIGELGLPRTNLHQDFDIAGYIIPKGTPVLANYWGIHYDPLIFPNPDEFDPRHFLTENNELKNTDRMLAYAVGRRSCVGEPLARIEIYLFFVILILRYKIEPPEGVEVDLIPREDSGMNQPKDFKIRATPRSKE